MTGQIARLYKSIISKYLFIIFEIVYRSFSAINGNKMSLKTTIDISKINIF